MPKKKDTIVATLLNTARPMLVRGWEARRTGCDELAIRHLALKRYAVLPEEAADFLALMDGRRTLNQIAAELLKETGQVRHRLILESMGRLHAAGLLYSLGPELDNFLRYRHRLNPAQRFKKKVGELAEILLALPIRMTLPRSLTVRRSGVARVMMGVFLGLYFLSLLPYARWLMTAGEDFRIFGPQPSMALMAVAVGILAGLSLMGLARNLLLLLMGRSLYGVGVKLSLGLPHLSGDHRDEAMLTRVERMFYHAGVLLTLGLGVAAVSAVHLATGSPEAFYLGFGLQLMLVADMSPVWASDLSRFMEEAVSYRRLRHQSGRYLLRRIWRNLVRFGAPKEHELTLMLFASAWVVYLALLTALLLWLLPGSLGAVKQVMFHNRSRYHEIVLAMLTVGYFWLALLGFGFAILATFGAGLAQMLKGRDRMKPLEVKTAEAMSLEEVAQELQVVPPFSNLSEELVLETLQRSRVERYPAGATVIRQGEPGDSAYVLRVGTCRVEVEDENGKRRVVGQLEPGYLFGEVALLASTPRAASVIANTNAELLALDRETFMALTEQEGGAEIMQQVRIHLFLHEVKLLKGLGDEAMARLVQAVKVEHRKEGDVVITEGEQGDSMYLIFSGSCEVTNPDGKRVAVLKQGNYFGEIALATGGPRTASIFCMEPTVLLKIEADVYHDIIVGEFSTGLALDREVEGRLQGLSLI